MIYSDGIIIIIFLNLKKEGDEKNSPVVMVRYYLENI